MINLRDRFGCSRPLEENSLKTTGMDDRNAVGGRGMLFPILKKCNNNKNNKNKNSNNNNNN